MDCVFVAIGLFAGKSMGCKPSFRILLLAVFPYFKMEQRAGQCFTASPERTAFRNVLSFGDGDFGEMRVYRAEAVGVINNDKITE